MDLHQIVSGGIGQVNPYVTGSIQVSTGNQQNPNGDGTLIPTYNVVPQVPMQVQELTERDIRMLDGLNIQGSQKVIYVRGLVQGLVRTKNKGGDLITLQDGSVWLVTAVLEAWPDWCKVSVTLQNGS